MITVTEARRYYEGADAVHDFDHVLRVLALAERIGRAEGADLEIVRTAALLHDAGREGAEAQGLRCSRFRWSKRGNRQIHHCLDCPSCKTKPPCRS